MGVFQSNRAQDCTIGWFAFKANFYPNKPVTDLCNISKSHIHDTSNNKHMPMGGEPKPHPDSHTCLEMQTEGCSTTFTALATHLPRVHRGGVGGRFMSHGSEASFAYPEFCMRKQLFKNPMTPCKQL